MLSLIGGDRWLQFYCRKGRHKCMSAWDDALAQRKTWRAVNTYRGSLEVSVRVFRRVKRERNFLLSTDVFLCIPVQTCIRSGRTGDLTVNNIASFFAYNISSFVPCFHLSDAIGCYSDIHLLLFCHSRIIALNSQLSEFRVSKRDRN